MVLVVTSRSEGALVPIVEEVCRDQEAGAAGWSIERSQDPAAAWIRLRRGRTLPPEQGWKLHVSATVVSAEEVLRLALPVLLREDASFKVAASLRTLDALNQGRWQISQIGKFITVYPNDDEQAVRLASALDEATRGRPGPAVPSDRPLNPGSLVHYRDGVFGDRSVQTPTGDIVPAILGPAGEVLPDERQPLFRPPDWAVDPFVRAGVATELPAPTPLIGERYLIVSLVHQSPSGAVYLAADLEGLRACVIKRGCCCAAVGADGRDARARLRHEAAVLARLAPDPIVPSVFALVEQRGDLYLVMEDVAGQTLDHHVTGFIERGCCLPVELTLAWGRQLAERLAAIHAAGFVYRDLKASNVIVAPDGRLRLIDFELACDVGGSPDPGAGGTRGYSSPEQVLGRPPTVRDDVYALGALLYYLATAGEPPLAPRPFALRDRPLALMNPGSGPALDEVIARCVDPDPGRRFATMAEIGRALAEAGDRASAVPAAFGREPASEPDGEARRRSGKLARRLGDSLCHSGRAVPGRKGWRG